MKNFTVREISMCKNSKMSEELPYVVRYNNAIKGYVIPLLYTTQRKNHNHGGNTYTQYVLIGQESCSIEITEHENKNLRMSHVDARAISVYDGVVKVLKGNNNQEIGVTSVEKIPKWALEGIEKITNETEKGFKKSGGEFLKIGYKNE